MNTLNFCARYSKLYHKMKMIAYSILQNIEEAEDVASTVFHEAFEKKDRINEDTFENLLCISVRNKSVDTLRKGRIKKTIYIPAFNENFLTFEEDHDGKALSHDLHNAIQALPPIQRKLIIMKYLEGHDRKTMTSLCNSTENTVRNNLALALKNLRKRMINN